MASRFMALTLTPDVAEAQARSYGRSLVRPSLPPDGDRLGPQEAAFIQARDSFYLATVNQDGWPYLQHRGGPKGFLKVLDEATLGFMDLQGNRQLLSRGNLIGNDRVCLFLMSYLLQARLKILGRAEVLLPGEALELAQTLGASTRARTPERLIRIRVEGFDWNCPQHITPRYTEEEFRALLGVENFRGASPRA